VMGSNSIQTARERAPRALCRLEGNPEDTMFEGRPMWESYLPEVDVVLEAALGPGALAGVGGQGCGRRGRHRPLEPVAVPAQPHRSRLTEIEAGWLRGAAEVDVWRMLESLGNTVPELHRRKFMVLSESEGEASSAQGPCPADLRLHAAAKDDDRRLRLRQLLTEAADRDRERRMDFDDLVQEIAPPPNRVGKCEGGVEQHLHEGAVMIAYAMHVLRTTTAGAAPVHPDGERQAVRFLLPARQREVRKGHPYRNDRLHWSVRPRHRCQPVSGKGDVVADLGRTVISA